ncbi:hypothetical protein [Saccharopolyspora rosea]|uniref:Uncharacterized protein n=1 Tax=Saccharopolyspora rosea TaxID=524884 RepID=A0ABW3FX74_9PSEU|nr:hypothetical protein [Saccharopolyspora rosea]
MTAHTSAATDPPLFPLDAPSVHEPRHGTRLGGGRAAAQVALAALRRRFPGLRSAVPESEPRIRTGLIGTGLDALPVER